MNSIIDAEIKHSTFVRNSPEVVYDAIATTEGLNGWFCTGGEVDARPGGHIKFRWEDWRPDMGIIEDGGPVLEAERGKRFVFNWHPDKSEYSTKVEIIFESHEDGTIMKVVESGFQNTESGRRAMLGCATGWGRCCSTWRIPGCCWRGRGHRSWSRRCTMSGSGCTSRT